MNWENPETAIKTLFRLSSLFAQANFPEESRRICLSEEERTIPLTNGDTTFLQGIFLEEKSTL